MKKQAIVMGMPSTISIVDNDKKTAEIIQKVFNYFTYIDSIFSTYKPESEITKINNKQLPISEASPIVKKVFALCEQTKQETNGYFNINHKGFIDPSGIVKGYAIHQGAEILRKNGYKDFCVEIAGDIEVSGTNNGNPWRIGIENPFNRKEIIKIIALINKGIATSGNYIRGKHIYNPVTKKGTDEVISISVIGPNAYEADRFATAAFAIGIKGIEFIEKLKDFEAYMVTKNKQAYYTEGFEKFVVS